MNSLSLASHLKTPPPWTLRRESADPVIVSSRVRLARNLQGMPFPRKTDKDLRQTILQTIVPVLDTIGLLDNPGFAAMDELSETERAILCERHLISAEMTRLGRGSGVVVDASGLLAFMINEEDHLRMHALCPGMNLEALWATVRRLESAIAEHLAFSFRQDLGYLTACPSNVGTGMRASVMLHLAALDLQGELEAVFRGAQELGLAARGAFGEGSEPSGGFVQISNQSTLGEDEPALLRRLTSTVTRLVKAEHGIRQQRLSRRDTQLSDHVGRALGTLRYARRISSEEAFIHLGSLRLGVQCSLLPSIDNGQIDELLLTVQPGHLSAETPSNRSESRRDTVRATLIRQCLFPQDS